MLPVIALLVFVLQNTEHARIEFLGVNLDITQGFAILFSSDSWWPCSAVPHCGRGVYCAATDTVHRHTHSVDSAVAIVAQQYAAAVHAYG